MPNTQTLRNELEAERANNAKLTAEVQEVADKLKTLAKTLDETTEQLETEAEDRKAEEKDHEATRLKLGALQATNKRLAEENTFLVAAHKKKTSTATEARAEEGEKPRLRKQVEELQGSLDAERTRTTHLKELVQDHEDALDAAEAKEAELKDTVQAGEQLATHLKNQVQDLEDALDAAAAKEAELKDTVRAGEQLAHDSTEALAAQTLECARLRAENLRLTTALDDADRRSKDTKRQLESAARTLASGPEGPTKKPRRASAETWAKTPAPGSNAPPARAPVTKVREEATVVPAALADLVTRCANTKLDAEAVAKWNSASNETRALAVQLGQLPADTENTNATVMGLVTACEHWQNPATRRRVTKRYRGPLERLEASQNVNTLD